MLPTWVFVVVAREHDVVSTVKQNFIVYGQFYKICFIINFSIYHIRRYNQP